jgi:hypothetical protein
MEGRSQRMRRFGWQIGGVVTALGIVVALGVLAFGCGSASPRPSPSRTVASTPHATATSDPRVAQVEAAARRYVEALQQSAESGDPAPVDALVAPGSQAQGNAGIASSFSRDNHYAFIVKRIDYGQLTVSMNTDTATVEIDYALYGHMADWPSLTPRENDRSTALTHLHLEFQLSAGKWLVTRSS